MRDVIRSDWTSALPPQNSPEAAAHVDVRLRRHGDEAWRRDQVECTGWSAELQGFAGTIDSVVHQALTLARL
jgi:hypothetical protein